MIRRRAIDYRDDEVAADNHWPADEAAESSVRGDARLSFGVRRRSLPVARR